MPPFRLRRIQFLKKGPPASVVALNIIQLRTRDARASLEIKSVGMCKSKIGYSNAQLLSFCDRAMLRFVMKTTHIHVIYCAFTTIVFMHVDVWTFMLLPAWLPPALLIFRIATKHQRSYICTADISCTILRK